MKKISVVLPLLTPTPFLRAMTEFSIRTLRLHADNDFELVVVEAEKDHFRKYSIEGASEHEGMVSLPFDPNLRIDKYLNFNPKIGCVKELNAGVDAATGDFILSTGNDVFAPPHWDTELLRCFEERKDCGVASLSAFETGATVGPAAPLPFIVEGMYSPFMCFRKGQRFDEAFSKIYQDSDFVMRAYERGERAYRSCRAHVHHLLRMTSDRVEPDKHKLDLAKDEKLFYQRWGNSPLAIFGLIRSGSYSFGREYASFTSPVGRPDHPANGRRA